MSWDLPIPKGAIIKCPRCQISLMKTKKVLNSGEKLQASMFEGISIDAAEGDPTICPRCGADYFLHGRLKWDVE